MNELSQGEIRAQEPAARLFGVVDLYSTTPISDALFPNRGPLHFLVGAEEDLIVRALSGRLQEGEEFSMVLPGGPQARRALQLVHDPVAVDTLLSAGARYLGEGYRELAPGVFRSADSLRGFRMTTSDLIGHHGGPPHVNFESFDASGALLENNHVLLGR